ncbi:MAG TPA: signal peptide peptidase SppA, partial [Marmoricola sp.]|nr:signal peptide peptidase SppA [Marmoricola sp.]
KVLLELDLGRGIAEAPPGTPLEAIRGLHTPMLRHLVTNLRKAARDKQVVGLIATLGSSGLSLAQSDELRAAVSGFRERGKPTLAFSASFGEITPGTVDYYLATAFAEIWLQPSGAVGLVGFSGESLFVRAALDKLGVQPQIEQRHEFKSAADLFMREGMSKPVREMMTRLLDSATDTVVTGIAADRRLPAERIREVIKSGSLPASAAQEAGLIDHLGYRDEAYAAIRERAGVKDPTIRYVERYGSNRVEALVGTVARVPGRHRSVIGLIQASGQIVQGRSESRSPIGGGSVGSDTLAAALRAAARDDHVKGVVLRIDSPGGSYIASDVIRREILQLREAGKPVVASMASVAASGGYFIAMPCDHILANAGTITGSIGVLAGKQVLREGLDRLGVHRETIASGPFAAMFSSNTPFSKDQAALLNTWLDDVYADFTTKAAADRGMPLEDLRAVARGRVWTGADALEHGLVDDLGGLSAAIGKACELAQVRRNQVDVRTIPRPHPLAMLMPAESSDALEAALPHPARLEGPGLWGTLVAGVEQELGIRHLGVLSLPPLALPGLLPTPGI